MCLTNWLQAGHLQPPRRPSTAPAAGEAILAQVDRKIPLPAARMCSRLLLARSDMRREAIDEAVAVRADFHGGTVKPVAFRRRGREHRVVRVNAHWVDRSGRHPRFYFSVTAEDGDIYQLQLHAGDLVWWLDSVTLEG